MNDSGATDGELFRQILLSSLDPLVMMDVVERCGRLPDTFVVPNALFFGVDIDPSLHGLLRRLVSGAVASPFAELMIAVIEQSRLPTDFAGIEVLREMKYALEVAAPEPGDPPDLAGRIIAPDALCDLLLQPIRVFCDLFSGLATNPLWLAANPEIASQVFYRTVRPSYAETRLEVLILEELDLQIERPGDDSILNIP
jgi:hypothetical protein